MTQKNNKSLPEWAIVVLVIILLETIVITIKGCIKCGEFRFSFIVDGFIYSCLTVLIIVLLEVVLNK